MEEAVTPFNTTAAEWSAYCKAESDKKIRAAALKCLQAEVPETDELSVEAQDKLVDLLISFDTEGYFYKESTH